MCPILLVLERSGVRGREFRARTDSDGGVGPGGVEPPVRRILSPRPSREEHGRAPTPPQRPLPGTPCGAICCPAHALGVGGGTVEIGGRELLVLLVLFAVPMAAAFWVLRH